MGRRVPVNRIESMLNALIDLTHEQHPELDGKDAAVREVSDALEAIVARRRS